MFRIDGIRTPDGYEHNVDVADCFKSFVSQFFLAEIAHVQNPHVFKLDYIYRIHAALFAFFGIVEGLDAVDIDAFGLVFARAGNDKWFTRHCLAI